MKKAINFDLDTNALKKYYSGNYTNAYRDIGNFFKNKDFVHRQGSGYISEKSLNDVAVKQLIFDLQKQFSWLKYCVKKFDVTNIGKQYDMLPNIQKGRYILTERKYVFDKSNSKKNSLDDVLKAAKIRAEQVNKQNSSTSKANVNNRKKRDEEQVM